jgi:hypothetical protein
MGSKLAVKDKDGNLDFEKIEELTRSTLASIKQIRSK